MAQDGSDLDWAGAIIAMDFVDDVKVIRNFVDAYRKALSKTKRRK